MIGPVLGNFRRWEAEESLAELISLTRTAGALEAGNRLVEVRQISPSTFLGKGNVERLKGEISDQGATLVIFDGNLTPAQNKNLEAEWDARVIDRVSLILDIFALHAHSREGKLQVELAQYQYLYPRLVGAWTHFSRQRGGGVGLRGPGETQLEVDRRRIRDRITVLKRALTRVDSARSIHRKKRESVPLPTVTIVGYTNAGKTTLFNALTGASQLAEDMLFATLDPKTKRLKLPSGRDILITDTVGFIRNLPHQLVEAFKSTFAEAEGSDLLIHVVDASHPHYQDQISVVEKVLLELGLGQIPLITVFNKIDVDRQRGDRQGEYPAIKISASKKTGLIGLLESIDEKLSGLLQTTRLFLPHPYGRQLAMLYAHGRVFGTRTRDTGIEVEVALPEKWRRKFCSENDIKDIK